MASVSTRSPPSFFPEHSPPRLAGWIKDGRLTVDGAVLRPRDIVHSGAQLVLEAEQEAQGEWPAQDIELEIVYEDEHILVIDKPAGLVVHPAAGHQDGTLLNALLYHVPDIANAARRDRPPPGQGHDRPDGGGQDAGGPHTAGGATAGTVGQPHLRGDRDWRDHLRRHHRMRRSDGMVQRQKMAVVDAGKVAVSHYRVLERFRAHTHTRVKLETGRTHQIRVHMSHIGYPRSAIRSTVGASGFPGGQPDPQTLREFPGRRCTRASSNWITRPPACA